MCVFITAGPSKKLCGRGGSGCHTANHLSLSCRYNYLRDTVTTYACHMRRRIHSCHMRMIHLRDTCATIYVCDTDITVFGTYLASIR